MPLPELIEILPLPTAPDALVTVPGSKSITNRALVLAALSDGATTLQGALWSEDTQVMVDALRTLGFGIDVRPDPEEPCNRTIEVQGRGGLVPGGGTAAEPLELFVGNAGTAARFLAAMVCLGSGYYRLRGVSRMHERPQSALFRALRELGYNLSTEHDRLPVTIQGGGPREARCRVSIEESSQFASALLLCSSRGQWSVQVSGENAEESPYVAMTIQLARSFPANGGRFQIEPDASSGSYFWGTSWLLGSIDDVLKPAVAHWPDSGWQIDAEFPKFLGRFGAPVFGVPESEIVLLERHRISRMRDLADSIMTAIVLAPFAPRLSQFTDLQRLRVQECERVAALRTELTRCGARVEESGETLRVTPGALHGAEIETYHDHRMAMCFAILGLKVPGIKIKNPACVKKTFPNFFQKLACAPPSGLGAILCDGQSGLRLTHDELFAA